MNLDAIRGLNQATLRGDASGRESALARLGNPSSGELIEAGASRIDDPDRNVRVQMVRLLSGFGGEQVAEAMLRALRDPARRVRRRAALSCSRVAGEPRVAARLREMVEDEEEITKVRSAAFLALSTGTFLSSLAESPDEARRYFDETSGLAKYRLAALFALISLDPLPDDARALLRELVETGTREEAVNATRALCGYKVINLGVIQDARERRRIAVECEPAGGRVFFWVPREREHQEKRG